MLHLYDTFLKKILFLDFREKERGREERKRERERERERGINFLFHSLMHLLVETCTHPDRGSNLQPWCVRMTLSTAELPGQGYTVHFLQLINLH